MGELRGSGCKRGPAPHHSEKHHYRSALAAACVPCRQAEQKGGGERKRLTAGLPCCHSDCLCIESIERRFLGSGTLPVFFPSSSFLTVPLFLPAGFKPLCKRTPTEIPWVWTHFGGLKGHVLPLPSPSTSAGRGKIGLHHLHCKSAKEFQVMLMMVTTFDDSSGRPEVTEVTTRIKTLTFFSLTALLFLFLMRR